MKRKLHELTEKQKIETLDALYTAAACVKGREAMKLFLRDLLTPSERIMLGRRILIARALLNRESALSIAERMKVGFDTIYKVERWLNDQLPGYENAISEMNNVHQKRNARNGSATPYTLKWLKRKYPLHFLLFPNSL